MTVANGNRLATGTKRVGPVRVVLFVAFIAAVLAAAVGSAFGPAWAAADAMAFLLASAAVAFGKRRHIDALIRSTAGLAVLFGFFSLSFTSLAFPMVALIHGRSGGSSAALLCAGISAGVGVLIVSAFWPMQLRYYAALRTRADKARPLAARYQSRPRDRNRR
jgi:hypothetical protein